MLECPLYQRDKLTIGSGVRESGKSIGNAAVVPLNVFLAFGGMESVPEDVAHLTVIESNSTEVGEFVTNGHNLTIAIGLPEPLKLDFTTGTPCRAFLRRFDIYKMCHPRTKEFLNLFYGDVGVLHGVVEDGGGKHLWVVSDGGHNSGSLHWMNDIRESFATSFGTPMGLDSKL